MAAQACVTIGADPELFLVDNNNNTQSAIGIVGGSKSNPKLVKDGAVQEDNVLAEFNIDPARTLIEFKSNILSVRKQLDTIVYPHGLHTVVKSKHRFGREELRSFGSKALEFGCDPDMSVWTEEENPSPAAGGTLRTAGGHVHIGYPNPTREDNLDVVAACEFLLGIPSVIIDPDKERRELYGKSGSFRFKPYGVEYRVLSNFWLGSEDLLDWVYGQSVQAYNKRGEAQKWCSLFSPSVVMDTINNSDVSMARFIVEELGIDMPKGY